MPALILEYQGAVPHAARGRNGRQKGCERGYYNLHRNLNHSLLHTSPPFLRRITYGVGARTYRGLTHQCFTCQTLGVCPQMFRA